LIAFPQEWCILTRTLTIAAIDADFVNRCLSVLRDLQASDWRCVVAEGRPQAIAAGVCLWDWEAGLWPTSGLLANPRVKHLYLVRPADLPAFTAAHPLAEGDILLKPVTRPVLAAFLRSAIDADSPKHPNLLLQQYDRELTDLLARTAHDFRSPLAAVSGFCELLGNGQLGPLNERQEEAIHCAQNSIKRMQAMTKALFEFSVAGERDSNTAFEPNDICGSIQQAAREIAPQVAAKQIALSINRLSPPPSGLYFDRSQIEQVLVNLLDNARKASPKRGSIGISGYPYFWERRFLAPPPPAGPDRRSRRDAPINSYRVDIHDSGPGVPAEHLEDIFDEYRSYFARDDKSSSGLGLAISRQIIHRHKGTIWASKQPAGAVFSFVIPFESARGTS
jgi:signal transduction histidine kinase